MGRNLIISTCQIKLVKVNTRWRRKNMPTSMFVVVQSILCIMVRFHYNNYYLLRSSTSFGQQLKTPPIMQVACMRDLVTFEKKVSHFVVIETNIINIFET